MDFGCRAFNRRRRTIPPSRLRRDWSFNRRRRHYRAICSFHSPPAGRFALRASVPQPQSAYSPLPWPVLASVDDCGSLTASPLCPQGTRFPSSPLRTHFPPACGPVVQSSQKALPCHLLVSLPTCGSFCPSGKCALRTHFPPVPLHKGGLTAVPHTRFSLPLRP